LNQLALLLRWWSARGVGAVGAALAACDACESAYLQARSSHVAVRASSHACACINREVVKMVVMLPTVPVRIVLIAFCVIGVAICNSIAIAGWCVKNP
jgi:hypothetical protein